MNPLPHVPKLHLGTHLSAQLCCYPDSVREKSGGPDNLLVRVAQRSEATGSCSISSHNHQAASCARGLRPRAPGQQVARATRTLFAIALVSISSSVVCAQDTNTIPLAPPADPSQPPPVAQPAFIPSPADSINAAPAIPILVPIAPAKAKFDSAMLAFNAGQWVDAATAFSDFVRDFPGDRRSEEALYRLAESYRNLGRSDDALAAYTYQVQTYPDGPLRISGELRRGALLFDAGKIADAITPLQLVADKGDGDLQQIAKYLLGKSFLATQKEDDGRKILQDLVDAQLPGKFAGSAAQALAELDDSESKYADAVPLWQKALAASTDPAAQATAAARGGWSALQSKQLDVAEKLFQTARSADTTGGDARKVANTGLLRIFFQQKRYNEWLKLYLPEKDKLLDSARAEILYDLGHSHFVLKHWADAVDGFDAYLKDFSAQDSAVTAAYERFLALTQIDREKTPIEAEAYLNSWPKTPYRARVRLLEAQELSREKKYDVALPIWENLADVKEEDPWPHRDILLELARTYDQLNNFAKAATAYRAFLDDNGRISSDLALQVQARLAVCLQKSDQSLAATDAWKAVQSLAPDGSPEKQAALESLGLIYAKGGPSQNQAMVDTFHALLDKYPSSPLRAMGAFSVGDSLFKNSNYAGAEPLLLNARKWDATTWQQPATQRLVLAAYGMKNYDKTVSYLKEYETIPLPTDPQAQIAARMPAALFYWLGESARQSGKWDDAETYYTRVTKHPDPGDLLAGAWWQLGEVQSHRKEWAAAVASYEHYRTLKPDAKDATVVLLALGRAQLGAQNFAAATALGNQALLGEPEGPNSAAARMLLGETSFAAKSYPEAARMFATLAVLFDDPKIAPQAMSRAADAFEKAGDAKSAADWRAKLKDKYPQFQPAPYL